MASFGLQVYRITHSRLKRSLSTGIKITPYGELLRVPDATTSRCIMAKLDSNVPDCPWGRLSLDFSCESEQVLQIKTLASNEKEVQFQGKVRDMDELLLGEEDLEEKEKIFQHCGGKIFRGVDDILLFQQKGRYLWIWFEIHGLGQAKISNIRAHTPGDNFYRTFPQVYQNDGDFLHRYLSIYSTLYQDIQHNIDELHKLIQIETAPESVLKVLAGWLGLELEAARLSEEELRRFLLHGYELLRIKGTRKCVEGILSLFVQEDVYIVEKNQLTPEQMADMEKQYGSTAYDCTILIHKTEDEELRNKLTVILKQFTPFRSHIRIVFLGATMGLDHFAYLGINSQVIESKTGILDEGNTLTGQIYLE